MTTNNVYSAGSKVSTLVSSALNLAKETGARTSIEVICASSYGAGSDPYLTLEVKTLLEITIEAES